MHCSQTHPNDLPANALTRKNFQHLHSWWRFIGDWRSGSSPASRDFEQRTGKGVRPAGRAADSRNKTSIRNCKECILEFNPTLHDASMEWHQLHYVLHVPKSRKVPELSTDRALILASAAFTALASFSFSTRLFIDHICWRWRIAIL